MAHRTTVLSGRRGRTARSPLHVSVRQVLLNLGLFAALFACLVFVIVERGMRTIGTASPATNVLHLCDPTYAGFAIPLLPYLTCVDAGGPTMTVLQPIP